MDRFFILLPSATPPERVPIPKVHVDLLALT